MRSLWRELLTDEEGMMSVEAAMVLCLVAVGAIIAWHALNRAQARSVGAATRALGRTLVSDSTRAH